jgi:tetratricopeptide (TPR) repeat protein
MLRAVAGHSRLTIGLPRDPRNTARETRARFEYQDACVVLRCIPNLIPGGTVEAVVIEWTTDYVVLGSDGRLELVSVKHREQDQRAWTFGDLAKEHVFRDLHAIWREADEDGDYVFESSRAVGPRLRRVIADATEPATEAAAQLARVLGTDQAEAARFAARLVLPQTATPDRGHIREVATARLGEVMSQLGLDPALASECVRAMEARVAAIAVDRPLDPTRRVRALAGLMRDVRDQQGQEVANFFLTMDELRGIVTTTAIGRLVPARAHPPADDPLFTGREAELAELANLLTTGADGMVTPVVLTGMPGIGKTALSARFAATSPKRARMISADSRAALISGIHQLNPVEPLAAPGGPSAAQPSRPSEPTIPDDPGLLLIIDGLSDPAVVAGLLPRASRTSILITATCPHVDDGFRHLPVGGLSPADAEAYLRRVMPAAQNLSLLITAFDGNALGLVQGANYCMNASITPRQYIERLQRDPTRLLDRGHAVGHPQTIAAAISAGLTEACTEPTARALASALSWLAPDPVPEWVFGKPPILVKPAHEDPDRDRGIHEVAEDLARLTDPLILDAAIVSLARHGLVSREGDGLRMHHLVQDVAQASVGYPAQTAYYQATVGVLLAAVSRDDIRPSPDVLFSHLAAVVHAAARISSDPLITSYLMVWLGEQHFDYGDLEPATSYLQQAAEVARQPGLRREVLSAILRVLVRVRRAAGDVDAALAGADEWAEAARSAGLDLDEYHARFARVATLAYAHRFGQAGRELGELAGQLRPTGLTVSDTIMELSVLAEICRAGGDAEAALDALTQAKGLARDQTTGLTRADHIAALSAQASELEMDLGHPAHALERQREAVCAARELGLRTPLANELQRLASRLIDCDQTEEAAEVLSELKQFIGAVGEPSRPRGGFLHASGRLALANGDADNASRLLAAAIEALEASGEPFRPELATAWYNLGTAQMTLRQPVNAAASYQKAREIEAGIYGEDHPELIATEYSQAVALYASGDLDAAAEAINQCLQIIRGGGSQARIWRDRALTLAITIDLQGSAPAEI